MNEKKVSQICLEVFSEKPSTIERCTVGQGNFVYIVECGGTNYVLRCSAEKNAYGDSIYWLKKLLSIDIPVPEVIAKGKLEEYEYLILSYLEGKDIGLVYTQLKQEEKRAIAKEIVHIQNQAAALKLENIEPDWSWSDWVNDMLDRARNRIMQNGYFETERVERLRGQMGQLETYFAGVNPVVYLDDISSKNLLIHDGRISGVIDIDWIGIGDKLTFAALTNMALLNLEYDTDYVKYILEEMQVNETGKKAFLFYTLVYCVDFMGERGMQFMDKKIEADEQIVERLNRIYDLLWEEWVCLTNH
ncbi:MAG: phosphotransferase [Lachnospiraceae bacterium]|nr:phosphotransferase [Lachnospiraceae bacterium]